MVVLLVVVMTLALASVVWVMMQPHVVGHATVVMIPPDGQAAEVLLPLRVDPEGAAISVSNETGHPNFGVVIERYPVSDSTAAEADVVTDVNGTNWLRLRANGTMVIGIVWEPRNRNDVLPFGGSTPKSTEFTVRVPNGTIVYLVIISYRWAHWWWPDRAEVEYAISSTEDDGPTGLFPEGTLPINVLIDAAIPIAVQDGDKIPFVRGSFVSD